MLVKQTNPPLSQDDPSALFQRAMSLHRSGAPDQAIKLYRHLLEHFPRSPQTLFALGTAECQAGNPIEGIRLLDESLITFPNNAAAYKNRGRALASINRPQEAQESYKRAIHLNPDDAETHLMLADALYGIGRLEEALLSYERALQLAPDTAAAHFQRGNVLRRLNRPEEALKSYERAVQTEPDFGMAHSNRGGLLCDLGRTDEGLPCLERAIQLMPTSPELHTNRGVILQHLKRFDEALQAFEAAIRARPDYAEAHYHKAELLLLTGDYRRGWELYEWRWQTALRNASALSSKYPLWTGHQPVKGKSLLIEPEVGFGDFIMFARFAALLRELDARIVMYTPRPLSSLYANALEGILIVEEGCPLPHVDFRCPIMSLPRAFATTVDTIPRQFPYLSVAVQKRQEWKARLGSSNALRVGLMWTGKANRDIDNSIFRSRSVPLQVLEPLFELPMEIHSLQKETQQDDAAWLSRTKRVMDHQEELADFSDTAALIEEMDLIISVDTSVAHLAGALARPLWVMLPYAVDYRWGLGETETPWYPTATLFRQPSVGDWESVVQKIKIKLIELLKSERAAEIWTGR